MTDRSEYARTYYLKNKERMLAKAAKWRADHPEKFVAYRDRWRADNKEHERETNRQYRQNNAAKVKEISRRGHIRRKFGMSPEEFEARVASQKNQCATCSREFSETVKLCIDHCHATGKVRGLLCNECNSSAGYVGDDPDRLEAIAAYLRKHRASGAHLPLLGHRPAGRPSE